MSIKGKTLKIEFSCQAAILSIFSGRAWALTFRCGSCKVISTINHNEEKKWCKCPACKKINKLKETSWYHLYG